MFCADFRVLGMFVIKLNLKLQMRSKLKPHPISFDAVSLFQNWPSIKISSIIKRILDDQKNRYMFLKIWSSQDSCCLWLHVKIS